MDDAAGVNAAILERLERVVESLQDNSVKMGQLLAVHNEKLEKQDRIDAVLFEKVESVHREVNRRADEIKKGCERDIRKIDERLRLMEKKDVDDCRCLDCDLIYSQYARSGNPIKFLDTTVTVGYNRARKIVLL